MFQKFQIGDRVSVSINGMITSVDFVEARDGGGEIVYTIKGDVDKNSFNQTKCLNVKEDDINRG